MQKQDITAWLPEQGRILDPPGCAIVFAPRPGGSEGICTVGIVHEHRFAFCFWADYARKNEQTPPLLLTLDSHNDVGGPCDVPSTTELNSLPLSDSTVVSLYAWLQLRALNDGHIYPALHLRFFADVYVYLPKLSNLHRKRRQHEDRFGEPHGVFCFSNEHALLEALPDYGDIYLDIDLDFFARGNNDPGRDPRSAIPWPLQNIRRFFRSKTGLIQKVLPRVVGMTIALEPRYCGGFVNSLRILDAVNQELFGGTLGTTKTTWRNVRE
jgi:hypothetical protein